jgi:hypothetical protein
MENKLTNVAGGTGLRPVQFGVTPNCVGALSTGFWRHFTENAHRPSVSGATPETTGVTPVPPVKRIY